ncbi:MAG: 4-(cytidine 5'-diphospho)-2-C-methyl-D-erythritol kinase [Candidatus Riflebacteria bacterium]|jgi:4-diphosphocytidyl-2-C-methyl-D-erythritol kinase|nr:4-(cytidine 5'-diphospho)-2-C-methyl-D-erythritol kinase [Candidatus Riflebacteria bacterium]NCB46085.1 4-(cytidine 5'-diphospho)-2-C-methyl-D-erythritol kinase [bacterium]
MKNTIIISSPAKINIGLWVKNKRPDNYHEIATVMQTISLADTLTLKETSEPGIKIFCDNKDVPTDSSNLIYKAAESFFKLHKLEPNLWVKLEKKIPVAAGLAGGSSNAAATLLGLSKLYEKSVILHEIMDLASTIGSDVPFVLYGGLALAHGRGEKLFFHEPPKTPYVVVIVMPNNLKVSTKWAYDNFVHSANESKARAFDKILSAYQSGDIASLKKLVFNDLESVTLKNYPEIARIKEILSSGNNGLVLMSGSGPAIFGLFKEKKEALMAVKGLHGLPVDVYIEHTTKKNL